MIGSSEIDQVVYIIHDGERIGKTNDYAVPCRLKGMSCRNIWEIMVSPVSLTIGRSNLSLSIPSVEV